MSTISVSGRANRKKKIEDVWKNSDWKVSVGRIQPRRGRPRKITSIFKVVGEKLPYESLSAVRKYLDDSKTSRLGVYMAHDSMGVARYGGRGDIFTRLSGHKRKYKKQLIYFSFYVVAEKAHRREIETAILRAAGGQMSLNQRKKREGIDIGNVTDFEPGTYYFERH